MNSPIQTFWGAKLYRLDAKRRVSIPPQWRPPAGSTVFLLPSVMHELPLLSVLNQAAYEDEVARLLASDLPRKAAHIRLGRWIMLCRETTLSDQGKLLIPRDLCEQAQLLAGSEVRLVGRYRHFEIWNKENFDRAQEIERRENRTDSLGPL